MNKSTITNADDVDRLARVGSPRQYPCWLTEDQLALVHRLLTHVTVPTKTTLDGLLFKKTTRAVENAMPRLLKTAEAIGVETTPAERARSLGVPLFSVEDAELLIAACYWAAQRNVTKTRQYAKKHQHDAAKKCSVREQSFLRLARSIEQLKEHAS